MNFRVVPDPMIKLSLLEDAMRFEAAGSDPLVESADAGSSAAESAASTSATGERGTRSAVRGNITLDPLPPTNLPRRLPQPLPCITEVVTPSGKKPIMKAMLTTACERNCNYCVFRAGRSKTQRITFTPDEMAKANDLVARAGLAQGIFLSSGIIKGGVTTQDRLIDTAEIIRHKYGYRDYLHLKIMPGAEYDQIRRAMQLADRVSVNLEGATEQRLAFLAPKKNYWDELMTRIRWMAQLKREEKLRASIVTQFVVGAAGESDVELLSTSERLYRDFGLRRAYYMSFSPVEQTPFEGLPASTRTREFRLYQASFLLRDYGWEVEDLPFLAGGSLPLDADPKLAWAQQNLLAPLEVNRAEREELLRVPGIGPKSADAIVHLRRRQSFSELGHLRHAGVRDVDKASPFLLLDGRAPARQLPLFAG
jgi:predicted DNA-binding helix-hairpin-helix protein